MSGSEIFSAASASRHDPACPVCVSPSPVFPPAPGLPRPSPCRTGRPAPPAHAPLSKTACSSPSSVTVIVTIENASAFLNIFHFLHPALPHKDLPQFSPKLAAHGEHARDEHQVRPRQNINSRPAFRQPVRRITIKIQRNPAQ